jgi:hypothetical protein
MNRILVSPLVVEPGYPAVIDQLCRGSEIEKAFDTR